jgi:hypothetical protein
VAVAGRELEGTQFCDLLSFGVLLADGYYDGEAVRDFTLRKAG